MTALARVVWSEGMHLAQHHFQAQNRYFEELISFVFSNLFFAPYGLAAYSLDEEALLNGTVSLIHARGVLPDGLAFNFPEDAPPQPLQIRELFSPTQDSHLVLLGIPAFRPTRSNCTEPGVNGSEARFLSIDETVVDETTGNDAKVVGVARKNFRLLLDYQASEDLVTLPLGRVRRDGSGHFVFDPEYIPPVLHVSASPQLVRMLSRLVEMLESKADALIAERGGPGGAAETSGTTDVASFWLSHAVHSSLAPLRHHLIAGARHPEALYQEMARIAGALCTFSMTSHPRDLPAYDHDELDRCFAVLDRHIRANLDVVMPTNCVSIPLQPGEHNIHMGRVVDRRSFDRGEWYLAVRSSGSAADLLAHVPKLVKVCSQKHIARLVREAYPGLKLEHEVSPPSEIPRRPGTQYFSIQRAGPCWQSMIDTAEIGVFVPDAIPDARLEVLVVLERGGG